MDNELTTGSRQTPRRRRDYAQRGHRRPATLDEHKKAFSYALGRLDRTVNPAHHNYQVRLGEFFKATGVDAEWERDYVDVRFTIDRQLFIGEIKVTGHLRLEEAFRAALGQLLVYAHTKFPSPAGMVMFLDREPKDALVALASALKIAIVVESENGWKLLNATDARLAQVFGSPT